MRKVVLNFDGMNSKEEIQEYLAEQMEFPFYYGKNLDALYDCLTDISEPVAVACHMPEEEKDSYMEAYLDKLYGTFRDAEADNGNLAVFFGHLLY
jgi:ribonuclease inhibitor